jgi:hypothetical protein
MYGGARSDDGLPLRADRRTPGNHYLGALGGVTGDPCDKKERTGLQNVLIYTTIGLGTLTCAYMVIYSAVLSKWTDVGSEVGTYQKTYFTRVTDTGDVEAGFVESWDRPPLTITSILTNWGGWIGVALVVFFSILLLACLLATRRSSLKGAERGNSVTL